MQDLSLLYKALNSAFAYGGEIVGESLPGLIAPEMLTLRSGVSLRMAGTAGGQLVELPQRKQALQTVQANRCRRISGAPALTTMPPQDKAFTYFVMKRALFGISVGGMHRLA